MTSRSSPIGSPGAGRDPPASKRLTILAHRLFRRFRIRFDVEFTDHRYSMGKAIRAASAARYHSDEGHIGLDPDDRAYSCWQCDPTSMIPISIGAGPEGQLSWLRGVRPSKTGKRADS